MQPADSRSAASAVPASPTRLATPRCGPPSAHTDSSTAPRPAACWPCVRSGHVQPERTPHRLLDRQAGFPAGCSLSRGVEAPAVFSDHAFQRFAMQTQLRHQQLQSFRRRSRPSASSAAAPRSRPSHRIPLPAVERSRADPVLTAQLRRLHTSLALLQDPDDLPFRVPALLHLLPSSQTIYERTPASNGRDYRGQVRTSP